MKKETGLRLKQVDRGEWVFVHPRSVERRWKDFDTACELMDTGMFEEAERVLRGILEEAPTHLDAMYHLGLILHLNDEKRGGDLWEEGARLGREAFPPRFKRGEDRLEWGWIENRPFLRCLAGCARVARIEGRLEDLIELCREMLDYNPNDNQGMRETLVWALLKMDRPREVLDLCNSYIDDRLPGILYGRPLALIKLGRKVEAERALETAVWASPLIAMELLREEHERPDSMIPGFVTVGGEDEAYIYSEDFGQFWEETPGAMEMLESCLRRAEEEGAFEPPLTFDTFVDTLMELFDRSQREQQEEKIIRPNVRLRTVLNNYPAEWVNGIAATLGIEVSGKKRDKIKRIVDAFQDRDRLAEIVSNLPSESRDALRFVAERGGWVKRGPLFKRFGDVHEDGWWWHSHPPESVVGRLRSHGLIALGRVPMEGKLWRSAVIPKDVLEGLRDIGFVES